MVGGPGSRLRFSENLSRNRRLVRPWTVGDRLRHAKFGRLREDKDARLVVKEHAREANELLARFARIVGEPMTAIAGERDRDHMVYW